MPDFTRLLRDEDEHEVRGKAHFPALGLEVDVTGYADDDSEEFEPVFRMLSAVLGHPHSIRDAVAVALFDYYHVCKPYWTTWYGGDEEADRLAPKITEPGQIWSLLRDEIDPDQTPKLFLSSYQNDPDKLAFVLSFPCTWDNEHGVAVRMERWAVARVGIYGSV